MTQRALALWIVILAATAGMLSAYAPQQHTPAPAVPVEHSGVDQPPPNITFAPPPQTVSGRITPRNDREEWALAVLDAVGNTNPSLEIQAFMIAWQRAEGSSSSFNPFNTTQPAPGATCYNSLPSMSCGVKNYTSREQGIQATVDTLHCPCGGESYRKILNGIMSNDPELALQGLHGGIWGTSGSHADQIYLEELSRIRAEYGTVSPSNIAIATTSSAAPPDKLAWGNPLADDRTVMTQGYGVGSHAPAEIWGGIDLALDGDGNGTAEPGSTQDAPVYATHNGTVSAKANTWPGGNCILLFGDGVRTTYCHLSAFAVVDGAVVTSGTLIARVGSTGNSSGPHLHYEVWINGKNTNPCEYMDDLC